MGLARHHWPIRDDHSAQTRMFPMDPERFLRTSPMILSKIDCSEHPLLRSLPPATYSRTVGRSFLPRHSRWHHYKKASSPQSIIGAVAPPPVIGAKIE